MHKEGMKIKIFTMSLAAILFGLVAHAGNTDTSFSCQAEYERLSSRQSNILSNYEASPIKAQSALTELEKDILSAVQHCKNDPKMLVLLSDVEITRGENGKALIYARQAEVQAPNMVEANYTLGNVLTLIGDYEKGLKYIEKASNLAPEAIYILASLCSNYEMAKQYNRAVEVCTKVVETGDKIFLGSALYIRARAYKALGQMDKADLDFKRSKAEGYDGSKYYSDEHLKGGKLE